MLPWENERKVSAKRKQAVVREVIFWVRQVCLLPNMLKTENQKIISERHLTWVKVCWWQIRILDLT